MTPTQDANARIPVVEVIVTDDIDVFAASRLYQRLDEALQLRPDQLVVDLSACTYIDAGGIGMLLQVHRQARRHGAQLILRSPSARLRRNLRLARVDRVLDVIPPAAGTAPR